MRIDFNVLWIDDQPEAVNAQRVAIAKKMEDEGFAFNPTQRRSVAEVRELIKEDVFNDEIDLILVDWDLGGGVTGDSVIAEIRDSIPYKDVVFYSALNQPDELRRLAYAARVEGIYCTRRENLIDEVVGVFESLVKKVLDLDHTRGIVMGATSDIDHMVLECLTAIHGKLDDDQKKEIFENAVGIIDKRMKENAESFAKIQEVGSLAGLMEAHMIFTANDRLRVLSTTLKAEALKAHRPPVLKYMQDVVPKRNNLGHKLLSPEGKSLAIALQGGDPVSLEGMRELRRLILKLRGEFRDLLKTLGT